jgi:hypothetical protein
VVTLCPPTVSILLTNAGRGLRATHPQQPSAILIFQINESENGERWPIAVHSNDVANAERTQSSNRLLSDNFEGN